jgi:phosphoglycerate dehydrogenase-like enzyme
VRPLIIQTEELEPAPADWLRERAELVVCPYADHARLERLLPAAEALVVRTYTKVNAALLAKAPKLKVVGRAGVALENIDVPACRARGVEVVHTPGANTRAVVEFVTAMMLDALRPRVFLDDALEGKAWHEARAELTADVQLSDLTLGLWGFGQIGSAMARVGAALDMRVIYNDLLEIPDSRRAGATPVDVPTLLRESDVLSMHVDVRERNRGLLGAETFAAMKPDVVFINTSRGLVVDARALADHFAEHEGAVAILDVHDPMEPIPPGYPPLGLENVFITPHLASGTVTAKTNMSWVVRDIWRVLQGKKPEFPAKILE